MDSPPGTVSVGLEGPRARTPKARGADTWLVGHPWPRARRHGTPAVTERATRAALAWKRHVPDGTSPTRAAALGNGHAMQTNRLDTHQKAVQINLDNSKYGTFAE